MTPALWDDDDDDVDAWTRRMMAELSDPTAGAAGGRGRGRSGSSGGGGADEVAGGKKSGGKRKRKSDGDQEKGPKPKQEYMPKYRSGAYAILLTMYKEKRPLRKFEIAELAQQYAEAPILDSKAMYDGWSSITRTLEPKELVKRLKTNPPVFELLPKGLEVGKRVLEYQEMTERGGGAAPPPATMASASSSSSSSSSTSCGASSSGKQPTKKRPAPTDAGPRSSFSPPASSSYLGGGGGGGGSGGKVMRALPTAGSVHVALQSHRQLVSQGGHGGTYSNRYRAMVQTAQQEYNVNLQEQVQRRASLYGDVPCLASPTAVIPVQRPAPSSSTGAASRGDDDDDDCVALYTRQEERVLLNEDDYIDAVEEERAIQNMTMEEKVQMLLRCVGTGTNMSPLEIQDVLEQCGGDYHLAHSLFYNPDGRGDGGGKMPAAPPQPVRRTSSSSSSGGGGGGGDGGGGGGGGAPSSRQPPSQASALRRSETVSSTASSSSFNDTEADEAPRHPLATGQGGQRRLHGHDGSGRAAEFWGDLISLPVWMQAMLRDRGLCQMRMGDLFDLVVITDTNEKAVMFDRIRQAMEPEAHKALQQNLVIIADRKSLPTADFHFLLRLRSDPSKEMMLDFFIERKQVTDLVHSMAHNTNRQHRFLTQRIRMNETGFVNRCYLIEGSPETVDLEAALRKQGRSRFDNNRQVPAFLMNGAAPGEGEEKKSLEKMIRTIIAEETVSRSYRVVQTKDQLETARFILRVASSLLRRHCLRSLEEWCHDPDVPKLEWQTYNDGILRMDREKRTVRRIFGAMLMQIPRVSASAACVIMSKYPTLQHLLRAYDATPHDERHKMLADLRHMDGGTLASNTRLGPATSLNVYQMMYLSARQERRVGGTMG